MLTTARPRPNGAYHDLLGQIEAARAETDWLFGLVHSQALYDRPIPERNRIIFYLGHLEAFDWNLLQPRLAGLKSVDGTLDRLFAFGIDPVDGALPSDQPSDWPAGPTVEDYVKRIRTALDAALSGASLARWEGIESPATMLNVALEHRLMHAETLAYMLHQLPLRDKRHESQVESSVGELGAQDMIRIPAGVATLGISRDNAAFGWDNEYDQHVVQCGAFSIDRFKTTNGQYLEFVRAGGYQTAELWTEEAWNWIRREHITHPVFWRSHGPEWRYRGMFDEVPLPLDWPVYVSHGESAAYARWRGKRLPSEVEWHRAAYANRDDAVERAFPWGDDRPGLEYESFPLRRWDPWPVHASPCAASAFGVEGILANGWEWTSTQFSPFPGFQPFSFYPGYSAGFFDGKHYVMKGGSTRTVRSMLRRSFRNWFQPHYQFVYAGFRCAGD